MTTNEDLRKGLLRLQAEKETSYPSLGTLGTHGGWLWDNLDEIVSLLDKIETLEKMKNLAERHHEHVGQHYLEADKDRRNLIAERDALKAQLAGAEEALERIDKIEKEPDPEDDEYGFNSCHIEGYNHGLEACQSISRETLSRTRSAKGDTNDG